MEKKNNEDSVNNNFLYLMRKNYISFKNNHREWYMY